MSAPLPGDKAAGFSGLILGAIALFVIMFGIVRMTNAKYAGHEAAPAAGATSTTTGH
jgi:hypothetical protein